MLELSDDNLMVTTIQRFGTFEGDDKVVISHNELEPIPSEYLRQLISHVTQGAQRVCL